MGISVEIDHLNKIFKEAFRKKDETCALRDISLRILTGEIFALIGPNGAGKSTLVKILLGIVRPTGGEAFILGRPIAHPSVRDSVGYLPEIMHYPPLLSPAVFLHTVGRLNGVRQPGLSRRVSELLDLVDMKKWSRTPFRKFSKGMLQRIGLAQALVHNPRVLFLDEPSDGLDPVGRKDFRDLLKRLRDEGKTVFINSHLLSEVEQVADRIAVINKGAIVTIGTLNDIVPATGGYTVTIRGELNAGLRNALSIYPTAAAGGFTTVEVPSAAALESLLAILRMENIAVESFVPKRLTLEDSFLSLISGHGGTQ